jgi:hypothetical protein
MDQTTPFSPYGKMLPILLGVLLIVLPGCTGDGDGSRPQVVEAPYAFAAQDDYVYYPEYECYYSASRHQYSYRKGNVWVARATPPAVSEAVLRTSSAVRMDFHDPPATHHAAVVRQYPRDWKPTVAHQENDPLADKPRQN